MVTNLDYFISCGVTLFYRSNRPQFMGLLWSIFYAVLQARTMSILKANVKKLRKKIQMFYRQKCRDIIVSLNIKILKKPWKSIKVTPFHSSKNSIMNWIWKFNLLKSFFGCLYRETLDRFSILSHHCSYSYKP